MDELNPKEAGRVLDIIYKRALDGIPRVSPSVDELVDDYVKKNPSPRKAAWALCRVQIAKCGTSGFLTGLGGLITLPIAIPANLGSVLYVQMRMIAAVARIGGYDIYSDQVQTMIYMCLAGTSATDFAKDAGVKVGEKALEAAIMRIPSEALVAINQKIGFNLFTKFGEHGVISLGKAVPVVGGVISGAFDVGTTSAVAAAAISMFIDKEEKPRRAEKRSLGQKLRDRRDRKRESYWKDHGSVAFNRKGHVSKEAGEGEVKAEIIDISTLSTIEQNEIKAAEAAIERLRTYKG
jgi:hypothetical protein